LADEDYQLFNNLLSEKCPIIMNNLLNGNFRDMYCCETFKVEEITIYKKAEAEIVFNATKKFEENKF